MYIGDPKTMILSPPVAKIAANLSVLLTNTIFVAVVAETMEIFEFFCDFTVFFGPKSDFFSKKSWKIDFSRIY